MRRQRHKEKTGDERVHFINMHRHRMQEKRMIFPKAAHPRPCQTGNALMPAKRRRTRAHISLRNCTRMHAARASGLNQYVCAVQYPGEVALFTDQYECILPNSYQSTGWGVHACCVGAMFIDLCVQSVSLIDSPPHNAMVSQSNPTPAAPRTIRYAWENLNANWEHTHALTHTRIRSILNKMSRTRVRQRARVAK